MGFNMVEFIEQKRDGKRHSAESISEFVTLFNEGKIPDYQVSAWLMAVYFNGLSEDELVSFTRSIAYSGEVLDLGEHGINAVDKHSTGGVGDKTSLVVVPLVASCGVAVAKMSGRGLDFTGGTIDKLESIPNFKTHLLTSEFLKQVKSIGCCITGHSLELAPVEGKFYSLRDVTGTVPSVPLICSSIVSKKVAGGSSGFVFDVKFGSGAFMKTKKDAKHLATNLVRLSNLLGKKAAAIVSNMDQPLGVAVGNSLEVIEAIETLKGKGPKDFTELCLWVSAMMLKLGGFSDDIKECFGRVEKALKEGSGLEKFKQMIEYQGGNPDVCDDASLLKVADKVYLIKSQTSGYVSKVNALKIGKAVRSLGGGRFKKEDDIDLTVGIRVFKKVGDKVEEGEVVLEIYYNDNHKLEEALKELDGFFEVTKDVVEKPVLIEEIIE